MNKSKLKALSPLIATILLVVVSIILVMIILSWGKDFTTKSISSSKSLVNYDILSDKQPFIRFVEAQNGLYVFDYYAPDSGDVSFTITGYSLIGYNDYIPLEPEYTVSRQGKHYIPLGIIDEDRFTIGLLLDDGSYLSFKDITNKNHAPGPSDCPAGFVPVPGNYLYGTVGKKGGFCVAQYEMKVDEDGDGKGDINSSCKSWGETWKNNGSSCSYTLNGRQVVSSAEGYPLTDISQTDSILSCQSIGAHLITNEEWMTIARNIEKVSENWSSGTVGQGSLKRGNTGDGVSDVAYNGDDPESGTGRNELAKLTLSNGSEVWDLSGNVMEWVDKIYNNTDYNIPIVEQKEWLYFSSEYPALYESGVEVYYGDNLYFVTYKDLDLNYKDLFLLNPDYNRDNGIGYMEYEYDKGSDVGFLRGGYWSAATNAGLLYLLAGNDPSSTSSSIGFRCVVVPE